MPRDAPEDVPNVALGNLSVPNVALGNLSVPNVAFGNFDVPNVALGNFGARYEGPVGRHWITF